MSTCTPGLSKNNFCHTLYVLTINGRIILYLTGDKLFNFEVSFKYQDVKIKVLWEITRVRNWNSKVRTCKNKHCKKIVQGDIPIPLLFFCLWHRSDGKKKRGPRWSSKITNKGKMSLIVFGIIDHHWWLMIPKIMKDTGALFDELCLAASAYIENFPF